MILYNLKTTKLKEMRRKIVAGNWKMNNDLAQTESLISGIRKKLKKTDVEVMIAPPFTNLFAAFEALRQSPIEVVAQNMHYADNGAYTGEISAEMLKSIGISTVILGHSERRAYFGEDDALLAKKVDSALKNQMTIIFCFGEELADRKSENHFKVVENQLKMRFSIYLQKLGRILFLPMNLYGPLEQVKPLVLNKHRKCTTL